jgi:hypothetical protein
MKSGRALPHSKICPLMVRFFFARSEVTSRNVENYHRKCAQTGVTTAIELRKPGHKVIFKFAT